MANATVKWKDVFQFQFDYPAILAQDIVRALNEMENDPVGQKELATYYAAAQRLIPANHQWRESTSQPSSKAVALAESNNRLLAERTDPRKLIIGYGEKTEKPALGYMGNIHVAMVTEPFPTFPKYDPVSQKMILAPLTYGETLIGILRNATEEVRMRREGSPPYPGFNDLACRAEKMFTLQKDYVMSLNTKKKPEDKMPYREPSRDPAAFLEDSLRRAIERTSPIHDWLNKNTPIPQSWLVSGLAVDVEALAPKVAATVKHSTGCGIVSAAELAKRSLQVMSDQGVKVDGISQEQMEIWITPRVPQKPRSPQTP